MWCCRELLRIWCVFFCFGDGVSFFGWWWWGGSPFFSGGVLVKGFSVCYLAASSAQPALEPSSHSSARVGVDSALVSRSSRPAVNVCSPACEYCTVSAQTSSVFIDRWNNNSWHYEQAECFLQVSLKGLLCLHRVHSGKPVHLAYSKGAVKML